MTTEFLTTPHQTPYILRTNCPTLLCSLHQKHGQYLSTTPVTAAHTITAIKSTADSAESTPTYTITHESTDKVTTTLTTKYPLQEIEDIIYTTRSYAPEIFALHGGAVAHKGCAYLFLGATTSGKTTLISYLVNNGFSYITDDCILMNRETFAISPCTTPLHLRSGGLEVLRECHSLPEALTLLDDETFPRYVYTPDNCVTTPLPLGRIFFITRTEHVNMIENMNMTERITALLKSPILEYTVDGTYLQFIARLAKVPCHRLCYCDMNYVKEVLENES